jgi:hypothetical protein
MSSASRCRTAPSGDGEQTRWPLERVLFAIAGTVVLVSVLLSVLVSEWFLLLTAFVGLNQWLFVVFGDCPMSLFLTHVLHLDRGVAR